MFSSAHTHQTGILGGTLAAGYATLKGHSATLWSVAATGQCFLLGSTFWATRTILKNSISQEKEASLRENLVYSTLAGAVAGGLGGAVRGRANIVPGTMMMSILGFGGTAALATIANTPNIFGTGKPLLQKLAETSCWPLRSLSDEEYKSELSEKMLVLDTEISLLDDKIAELKQKKVRGTI